MQNLRAKWTRLGFGGQVASIGLVVFTLTSVVNGNSLFYWPSFDSAFGVDALVAFTQIVLAGAVYHQIQHSREAVRTSLTGLKQARENLHWQAQHAQIEKDREMLFNRLADAGEGVLRSCSTCFEYLRHTDGRLNAEAQSPGSVEITAAWMQTRIAGYAETFSAIYNEVQIWQLHGGEENVSTLATDFAVASASLHSLVKKYYHASQKSPEASRPSFIGLAEQLASVQVAVGEALSVTLTATPLAPLPTDSTPDGAI